MGWGGGVGCSSVCCGVGWGGAVFDLKMKRQRMRMKVRPSE